MTSPRSNRRFCASVVGAAGSRRWHSPSGVRAALRRAQVARLQLAAHAGAGATRAMDLARDVRPQGARAAGKSFAVLRGPILIPIGLVIVTITIASFFLNATFAMAIARPGRPEIRPALAQARQHLVQIITSGTVVGAALAFRPPLARWQRPWSRSRWGIVVGVMMLAYVALPARLIGVKPEQSPREKLDHIRARRDPRRDRLHTPVPARSRRHPDARFEGPVGARDLRPRDRCDPPGRCVRRGQGDQDEHKAQRQVSGRGSRSAFCAVTDR